MPGPRKVFLSYRSVDLLAVQKIAEQLRNSGIDAQLDLWEILPGDDFVAKINELLAGAESALVFLSRASLDGKWQQAEINTLTHMAVEEKIPVIPVLLDPDAPVPPLLRSRSRVLAHDFDAIVAAIERRTGKPPLGPARPTQAVTRFVIRLRPLPNGEIGVAALRDRREIVAEIVTRPGADFEFSYADFVKNRPLRARAHGPAEQAADREQELHKLGRAIGRVVFPPPIAAELTSTLDHARRHNAAIELVFESADPQLLSIPFEAARLPDDSAPALLPGVFTWRGPGRLGPALTPAPGPLKILVAVGAPDEGKTRQAVLDGEREVQTILDAVNQARQHGNAHVRFLEVGSPGQIAAALRERAWHVLHLSGHGGHGQIELEDEDGKPVPATADDIAKAIRDSGHPAPLLVLASCHGGLGTSETASLAQALLEQGVPAVMAMQTSVSDRYATEIAGAFYLELARAEQPLPSRALALARREREDERRRNLAANRVHEILAPEYATPSLFLAGEEAAILDRGQPLETITEPPPVRSTGKVPMLSIGDLIGRRREVRGIVRAIAPSAAPSRYAGCQILGVGGAGKSSVAGRVMSRCKERDWRVAAVSGAWNLGAIANAVASELWQDPNAELARAATILAPKETPDEIRLDHLQALLGQQEILLVLDNFEDCLQPAGTAFRDSSVEAVFHTLAEAAQRGKLLVTSRYPVPGMEHRLLRVDLGPLSRAETGKLMLRHEGLRGQSDDALRLIERAIGGHPRTLEYLDALLRGGQARLARVTERLAVFARQAGVRLDANADWAESVAAAIRVAAADALVDQLVDTIAQTPGDLELLQQAAVYPLPVEPEALGAAATEAAIARLVASSLLARADGVFVHRWTAEALRQRTDAAVWRGCCGRAGDYLLARKRDFGDSLESVRLLLAAEEFDRASEFAAACIGFVQDYGQTTVWTELAREVADALPDGHDDKLRFIGTVGDGLQALGLTGAAMERYRKYSAIAEKLVAQEPGRADFLRDLSVSYERLGDVMLALGQGEAARQYFEKSLAIAEKLVAQEPGRADFRRGLLVSYNKLGDVMRALGQSEAARLYFQQSHALAEKLVAQEPGRADFLCDLSVSYERLGDVMRSLGQGEAARQYFEKSLTNYERLLAQEPQRADLLRNLVVPNHRMGTIWEAQHDLERAGAYFAKALDILLDLQRSGRLQPVDEQYIPVLQADVARCRGRGAATGAG